MNSTAAAIAAPAAAPTDFLPQPAADAEAGALRAWRTALHAHLNALHQSGASGSALNLANSDALDGLLRRLAAGLSAHGAAVAVAAIGGYARREMSPESDVDLLFVVAEQISADATARIGRMQQKLWDAGFQLGAAVRTIEDCVQLGLADVSACTALLGTRFLAGDAALFHALRAAIETRLIPDKAAFVATQKETMRRRHLRFGESLYLLQPNIKEGAGALRDYHTALWAARATDPQVRDAQDLLHAGLLSEREAAELQSALDFFWRVRNALHLQSGRKNDRLTFEAQEKLAPQFVQAEPTPNGVGAAAGEELPVERFIRRYYRCARALQSASEMVIEQCEARVQKHPAKAAPPRKSEDGFLLAKGKLEIPHAAHLREQPQRMLRAFAVAQAEDVPLSRGALRLLRENLDLINDGFRQSEAARENFLQILSGQNRVMRTLVSMNEAGLLGRYLPEWERIVCRWQHVMYHAYTVDVHSIFLVEQLRRLGKGEYAREMPDLSELIHEVRDKAALYLGCLLHDIGKGSAAEDHSAEGEKLARQCLRRMGFEAPRMARALFVVRAHLLMSHIAQRRDLADPKVIVEFARACGDRENLRNLYLATFADMRASSDSGWSSWRRDRLRELYARTAEFLEAGGGENPQRAAAQAEAQVQRTRAEAAAKLRAQGGDEARIETHLNAMPRRYFLAHDAGQIARHAALLFEFAEGCANAATAVHELPGGVCEWNIAARDRDGLYGLIAGAITAAGLDILDSNVYTVRGGAALELYRLRTPRGGAREKRECWEQLAASVRALLAGECDLQKLLAARRAPVGAPRSPRKAAPQVSIRNDVSDFYSVIDLSADDRPGLLHAITRTLAAHGVRVYISKATTLLDQAADTFYVRDAKGKRLLAKSARAQLQAALLKALRGGESDG